MSADVPHPHVLLIEDDPALGAVTTEALTQLGYNVVWAVSASDGFASLAQTHRFGAVLLDLGLGSSDGVSMIASLRQQGWVLPPLLIFSAQPIDALRRAASAVGAKAILQKPCNAADLFSALQRAFKAPVTTYA